MFDLGHLPKGADVQAYFGGTGSATAHTWRQFVWEKPTGKTWLWGSIIGAGAGAGGGFSAAAGSTRGGGGGGAPGGNITFFVPLALLPDILYIVAGTGGAGGAPSAAGIGGGESGFGLGPNMIISGTGVVQPDALFFTPAGGAGAAASGASSGGAGSTGANGTSALAGFVYTAAYSGNPGTASGGSQTGAVGGGTFSVPLTRPIPGCGGAGVGTANTDFAGGTATAVGTLASSVIALPIAGAAGGGNGTHGYERYNSAGVPMIFVPSSGGGSSGASGTGGYGGNGGLGCGGSGGGGGVTGGAGGNGGQGAVFLICV